MQISLVFSSKADEQTCHGSQIHATTTGTISCCKCCPYNCSQLRTHKIQLDKPRPVSKARKGTLRQTEASKPLTRLVTPEKLVLQDSQAQAQPDELIDFHHLKARRGMSQLEIEDQVQTDLQRATGLAETGSENASRLNRVLQLTGEPDCCLCRPLQLILLWKPCCPTWLARSGSCTTVYSERV